MLGLPLASQINRFLNPSSAAHGPKGRRSARRVRPVLEGLEERALLTAPPVEVDLVGSGPTAAFSPKAVTINVGDTVNWVWKSDSHTVTSVTGSKEAFDSPGGNNVQNSGFTFEHTFSQVGTIVYYCKVHGTDLGNGMAINMFGTVTVMPATTSATLQSISVTPANPAVNADSMETFTATGTFSDNTMQNITSQVTWSSTNTGVATIDKNGVATGVSVGNSTITASLNGINGSTALTVNASAAQGTPPMFVNEMRMTVGKGAHKKVAGFILFFTPNDALNPNIASDATHYVVTQPGKKKNGPQAHVAVNMAMYNPTNNSVMLMLGKFTATKPLTAAVSGLIGANNMAVPNFTTRL
jgi:plastocyanin